MSTHKYIDKICCAALVFSLMLTVAFMNGEKLGIVKASMDMGYETRLFDVSKVHAIDIVMDDWEGFLDTCMSEEYALCSVIVDNEACKNVGIRAKGNTSLTQVESYGNDRYSFKIEFDHYDNAQNYYGLDKLSLNNIIQDNTYMKDYLTYQMMGYFGVDAPLCSYVYLTVNGEDWGLYLAVEGVEESFLKRNYGADYGELYKPDSQSLGGGRGEGVGFDMGEWQQDGQGSPQKPEDGDDQGQSEMPGWEGGQEPPQKPEDGDDQGQSEMPGWEGGQEPPQMPDGRQFPGGQQFPDMPDMPGMPDDQKFPGGQQMPGDGNGFENAFEAGFMGGSMGSGDTSLIYSDDEHSSYQNIFDSAKTDVSDADKDRLIASLRQMNEQENIEEVVDVDEVIRYFVVHNFVCNFDSYTGMMIHNYYLYEDDGKMSMIPWDYNLAFGGFQGAQDATALVNYPIDTPVSGGTVESRPMLSWIFSDEDYVQIYHEYFAEFIAEYFDSGYFAAMVDEVKELIAPYVEKDPTKFCTYEEFETGIDTLKEFCLLRAESVAGQLDGSIPSTSDGQTQNTAGMVDASGINISDMGMMNGNRGMFGGSEETKGKMGMPDGRGI
jgi:spore coat protein CotH